MVGVGSFNNVILHDRVWKLLSPLHLPHAVLPQRHRVLISSLPFVKTVAVHNPCLYALLPFKQDTVDNMSRSQFEYKH